ncbi:tektin-4 [Trichomycterus rosablanca]|uniref:tektin-4 n=1 Tax=Trichomycterus rosablanca TaxID=2290929 RepID=UPI002F34F193
MSSQLVSPLQHDDGTGTQTRYSGSITGVGTAGYRSAKYTPADWFHNNQSVLTRTASDRTAAQRIHRDSTALRAETEATMSRQQSHGTRLLGERLVDIHSQKSELERHLARLHAETELLCAAKRRLEKALNATEVPFMISTDNLSCRERRFGPDLVQDRVEEELVKELDLIRNVQALLKETLDQTVQQIRLNREAQQVLELDWSDKHEAYGLDDRCGRYRNTSTDTRHHAASATAQQQSCDPDGWASHTRGNLSRAEREEDASAALFRLCERVLRETAEDLRAQSNSVDEAFIQRCHGVQHTKRELELQLTQVLEQISVQERNVAALQQSVHDKEAPLRVVQSRLHQRDQRPNMELCRDPVQISLLDEADQLSSCVGALQEQLDEARASLVRLEESRTLLERNIECKTHSLLIDRHKCMKQRTHYPGQESLSGY